MAFVTTDITTREKKEGRKEGRQGQEADKESPTDGQTDTLADLQGVVVVSCERVSLGPFNALARPCSPFNYTGFRLYVLRM